MEFISSGYGEPPQPTVCLWNDGLAQPIWQGEAVQPSWLQQRGKHLYAAGEMPGQGRITTFVHRQNEWRQAASFSLPGSVLCHLAADEQGKWLAGSCWDGGDVFLIAMDKDGLPAQIASHVRQQKSGADNSNAHCAAFDKELLYVANLGLDAIYSYSTAGGRLEGTGRLDLPAGTGPRQLVLHPQKQRIYLITEYSNQVLALAYDNGKLEWLQSASTLPPGFNGQSYGASLCLSPDGNYLYGSNRGHNSVVCFKVDKDGLLKDAPVHVSCGGDWPRHIAIMGEGRVLAVANQKSGTICFLPINPENGSLAAPMMDFPHPEVSYVAEVTG